MAEILQVNKGQTGIILRMQTTQNLHSSEYLRSLLIISLILLGSLSIFAQGNNGNYNYLDFQAKPYYFGITMGLNNAQFKPSFSDNFILNDSINAATTPSGPGFNLGIVTNLKIGKYFDFRLLPTLSFAEKRISYAPTVVNASLRETNISSVLCELPFHIRYKSEPWNDIRVFVIGGIKYSFDVASEANARKKESLVQISPNDFALEIGAGIQFFFPFFIFSPEIKYSHGLGNTLIYDERIPQSVIFQQLQARTFTISFHFEG